MLGLLVAFLSVVLVGLAGTLAVLAALVYRRYRDLRFLFVGLGLASLSATGALSLVAVFAPGLAALFQVGVFPLTALVLTVLWLHVSLLRRTASHDVPPPP